MNVALLTAFLFVVFGILGVQLFAGVLWNRCVMPTVCDASVDWCNLPPGETPIDCFAFDDPNTTFGSFLLDGHGNSTTATYFPVKGFDEGQCCSSGGLLLLVNKLFDKAIAAIFYLACMVAGNFIAQGILWRQSAPPTRHVHRSGTHGMVLHPLTTWEQLFWSCFSVLPWKAGAK